MCVSFSHSSCTNGYGRVQEFFCVYRLFNVFAPTNPQYHHIADFFSFFFFIRESYKCTIFRPIFRRLVHDLDVVCFLIITSQNLENESGWTTYISMNTSDHLNIFVFFGLFFVANNHVVRYNTSFELLAEKKN